MNSTVIVASELKSPEFFVLLWTNSQCFTCHTSIQNIKWLRWTNLFWFIYTNATTDCTFNIVLLCLPNQPRTNGWYNTWECSTITQKLEEVRPQSRSLLLNGLVQNLRSLTRILVSLHFTVCLLTALCSTSANLSVLLFFFWWLFAVLIS